MIISKQRKIGRSYYDSGNYFDKNLKDYTNLKSPFQKYRISRVLQIYKPNKNEKVLDLGCGWGTFSFFVGSFSRKVVGIDFSKKSIEICNQLLEKSQCHNIKFIQADAQKTGLESESFDCIISADLFEHLYPKNFEKVLDECRRLLKKGGKLVVWTPHGSHFLEILKNNNIVLRKDMSHVHYKSMEYLLTELRQRDFIIKKYYYTESHIPMINILEKVLLPLAPMMRRRIAILAEKE